MTARLVIEIIGSLGVLSYVASYALLQLGIIKGSGYIYALMNLAGAVFVAISLLNNWNMWSALVSFAFTMFSLIGITRIYLSSRGLRLTPQEQDLWDQRFKTMSRGDLRRVLNKGRWVDGAEGDGLTQQGEPVTRLVYLSRGGVDIHSGGQRIAQVGAGEFIGELACMTKGPASATVTLNQPTRYFEVSSDALIKMAKSNPDLRAQLEFAFAGNIQSKLRATNRLLEQAMRQADRTAS